MSAFEHAVATAETAASNRRRVEWACWLAASGPPLLRKVQRVLEYWENSCYLDSLLMIIYLGHSPHLRNTILATDTGSTVYEDPETVCSADALEVPPSVPPGQRSAYLQDALRHLAGRLQASMYGEYTVLTETAQDATCAATREIIAGCLPDIRVKMALGSYRWKTDDSERIYRLLVNLFPTLRITTERYVYSGPEPLAGADDNPVRETTRDAIFYFEDFFEGPRSTERANYSLVDWSSVSAPTLVFVNRGTEGLRDYGVTGYFHFDEARTNWKFKYRAFGEYILAEDDPALLLDVDTALAEPKPGEARYRLFAVIMFDGSRAGGHFTSYVRDTTNQWYYYNDIGGQWRARGLLPYKVFENRGEAGYPSMYFYEHREGRERWSDVSIEPSPRHTFVIDDLVAGRPTPQQQQRKGPPASQK